MRIAPDVLARALRTAEAAMRSALAGDVPADVIDTVAPRAANASHLVLQSVVWTAPSAPSDDANF